MLCATYFVDNRAALLAVAEANVTKGLSLAPEHAPAHAYLGTIKILTNRAVEGIADCERALALDHNVALGHAAIGAAKIMIGCSDETEAHINEALRLSPRDRSAHVWLSVAGSAKLFLGSDEDAVAWFRRAIEANRNYPFAHFLLAVALAHLHRSNEAQAAKQTGLALHPTFTIARYRAGASSDNQTYLTQRQRIYEGMRKAGVPEG
jgi:tetratricopeptide (TPR) repeat protein